MQLYIELNYKNLTNKILQKYLFLNWLQSNFLGDF